MENFSTSRVALLPRAANLATLAVVVAATWWSGAQRPAGQPVIAQADTATEEATAVPMRQAAALSATSAHNTGMTWPVQANALPRDGLQAVGFQPRTQR